MARIHLLVELLLGTAERAAPDRRDEDLRALLGSPRDSRHIHNLIHLGSHKITGASVALATHRRTASSMTDTATPGTQAPTLVREFNHTELKTKPADRIGQPSADADSHIHIELIREHRRPTAPDAPIAS